MKMHPHHSIIPHLFLPSALFAYIYSIYVTCWHPFTSRVSHFPPLLWCVGSTFGDLHGLTGQRKMLEYFKLKFRRETFFFLLVFLLKRQAERKERWQLQTELPGKLFSVVTASCESSAIILCNFAQRAVMCELSWLWNGTTCWFQNSEQRKCKSGGVVLLRETPRLEWQEKYGFEKSAGSSRDLLVLLC